jgi:DNA replication protein DnaC
MIGGCLKMLDKKALIRKCKKRLEEIKKTPPKPETAKSKINKQIILDAAKKEIEARRHNNEIDTQACAYEAAGDLINLNRGRLMFCGGFGSGHRLGVGRWRYINGEWIKKE